mgnify:FL=1
MKIRGGNATRSEHPGKKSIYVYDEDYKLIKQFESGKSAATEYKTTPATLKDAIKKGKKFKGFYFSHYNPFFTPVSFSKWIYP